MTEQSIEDPPIPEDEAGRLQALEGYNILDTAPEEAYDDLTRIAARACGTPQAAVHFIEEDRQWVKAVFGGTGYNCSRAHSFCAHAICQPDEIMVIPDARKDPRFTDNPFTKGDPPLVFYAGAPILSARGQPVGTLCVFDQEPRTLDEDALETLAALSRQLSVLLELRRMARLWRHMAEKVGQSL